MPKEQLQYQYKEGRLGFTRQAPLIKRSLLCVLFLLTGCCGPGDRLPEIRHAQVDLSGNQPCITYAVSRGDHISSVQIASVSVGGEVFFRFFMEDPPFPKSGQCLPLFDYHFIPEIKYFVYYSIYNGNNPEVFDVKAEFILPGAG